MKSAMALFGATVAIMALVAWWWWTPPLSLVMSGDKVVAHVETFGEYPTTVLAASVRERQSGRIVWRIQTKSGVPQIHDLTFSVGLNPVLLADPSAGSYTVVVPSIEEFRLGRGIDYVLEISGSFAWASTSHAFRFPLSNPGL